jgi:hypothetical protein
VDRIKLQSVRAKPSQLDALIIFSEMILVRKLLCIYHSYLGFFNARFIILLKEVLPGDLPTYSAMTSNGREPGPKTYPPMVHMDETAILRKINCQISRFLCYSLIALELLLLLLIRVPTQKMHNFTMFSCSSSHCPSARCVSVANAVCKSAETKKKKKTKPRGF